MIKLNKGVHIKNLKQALNLKKVHRIIKFIQKTWLTSYIDINTDLKKEKKRCKNWFFKRLSKLINNAVFGKTMENVRKHRDIKLVATEARRIYLVLEPNYHAKTFFLKIY